MVAVLGDAIARRNPAPGLEIRYLTISLARAGRRGARADDPAPQPWHTRSFTRL